MEPNLHADPEPKPSDSQPISVLVVEDECMIGEWVSVVLTEQGFTVETVTNANDALERLAASPIDILFTDINLGDGMDGADLARHAREMRPHLPVIYASARATLLKQEARVPGSVILPKPYEPSLLGRLLTATLRATAASVPV